MPFQVGDNVVIRKLKRAGRVKSVSNTGHYEVEVGTLVFHCAEDDLVAGKVPQKSPSKDKLVPNPRASGKPSRTPQTPDSIDLHGLTVEEAMKRVEEALNRALLDDKDQLRIMHGLGTGRVRDAVHAYLKKHGIASHFKLDDANPGVTIVYF
jgi:DNA mismatch repair protein MutS2